MAKIIKFKSKKEEMIDYLQELIEIVKKEKINNILLACENSDGTVMTGYKNLDMKDKINLLTHVKMDIVDQFMIENIDRYIELL